MPSLKSIRKRIASVKNTQKITKAMKMVATAKLRRAQDAVKAIRPYANHLGDIAEDLAARLLAEPELQAGGEGQDEPTTDGGPSLSLLHKILVGGTDKRVRLVVVSADRGLAGAYNSSIFRRAERFATEIKLQEGHSLDVVVVGKKGRDYFRRRPFKVVAELPGVEPKTAAKRARELSSQLNEALLGNEVDAIYVLYNEFKSAASQVVRLERLLPVKVRTSVRKQEEESHDEPKLLIDFIYEPDRPAVLTPLLPLFLETELTRIFLEAIASEMGARMSAMDNASRNAKEMIARLTLQYNRARQAAITKELMEIVGGAEALKG